MRGYFLTNMYLSPIQCGIQPAHCLHDMFITYLENPAASFFGDETLNILKNWSRDHKTMIVLNGGTSDDLWEVHRFLLDNSPNIPYPFELFREPGIDGALTCVGVILNEHMVEAVQFARQFHDREDCPIFTNPNVPNVTVIDPQWDVKRFADDSSPPEAATWDLVPKYTEVEWKLAQILGNKPLA